MSDRFATTPPSHGDDEPRRTGEEPRASNLDDLSPWSGRRSQGSGGPEWKDLDLRSRAKLLSTALGWGVTAARYLWAAGGIRSLINWTVMRHGWLEVRARGPGIDTTGRAEAHYAYSGFLNSSSSGWSIHFGRGPDDPRGGESSGPQPNPWCEVMLQTEWPLEAGVTYRTDGTDARTRLVSGAVLGVPEPYSSFAAPGVMQVDEASRGTVRGRFHLTLPRRVNQGSGPPVVVEGTFEIRRKRPRPG